jgi:hypothetical protein
MIYYNTNLDDVDLFKKTINFLIKEFQSDKARKLKTVTKTITFRFDIDSEKDDNSIFELGSFENFIYTSFKKSGFRIITKPQYGKIFDLVMVAPPKSNLPQNVLWLLESKKKKLKLNEVLHILSYLDKRSNIGIIVSLDKIDQSIYNKINEIALNGLFLILLTNEELKQSNKPSQLLHVIEEKFKKLLFLSKYGG